VAVLLGTTAEASAIAPVAGVTATPGNGQVQLTWTNPGVGDFDHVNIYRATSRYGALSLVQAVPGPGTTWTDATAVNGTDYWYVLRAATVGNVESPDAVPGGLLSSWYTSTAFTTLAGQRMDATVNYPTTGAANPFGQATSFGARWEGFVYMPTSETWTIYSDKDEATRLWIDGALVLNSGCCPKTSIALALNAGWHTIRLELDQGGGNWRQILTWSTPTLLEEVIPATNLGTELRFQATPRNNTLSVTAPNGGETITTASSNVTWTSTGTLDRFDLSYSLDGGATWGGTIATNVPSAATTREWLLPPGILDTDVRVRIRALSANGIVLASDTSNANFTIDTPPVPPVTGITATPGNGSVALAWTNPVDASFDHVEIYRAANEYDTGTLVHTTGGPATSSWADASVINGTEYTYRVRSVDTAGRTSPDITAGSVGVRWYDGVNFDTLLGTTTSNTLADSFGNSDGPGPLPQSPDYLGTDSYSGRYSGWMLVPTTGTYHFRSARRSGARMWVDGTQVMNEWNIDNSYRDTTSSSIALSAGWVPIRFEFVTSGSDSTLQYFFKRTADANWVAFDGSTLARETSVSVVPRASTVTITAPNGGESFRSARRETISWTGAGPEATAVDLWYSTDGGTTYPNLIVRGQPLTGSFQWQIPGTLQSNQVRIRAIARSANRLWITNDSSNANFTIDTISAPPPPITGLQVTPGNGQNMVSWTMPAPLGTTDHVRIYRNAGIEADIPTLVHETAGTATTSWIDPSATNGTRYWYYVRTVDASGRERPDITNGRVRAVYYDGASFDSYRGVADETFGFEGGRSFGSNDGPVVFGEAPDWLDFDIWSARYSGHFYVPESTTYRLRVHRRVGARLWVDGKQVLDEWYTVDNGAYDSSMITMQLEEGWHPYRLDFTHWGSDAFLYFQSIRPSSWTWDDFDPTELGTENSASAIPSDSTVTVTAPNGGELFANQRSETISWTMAGTEATSVDLWYSTDGGATYPYLITRGQPTNGSFQWLVPANVATTQARVRAVATTASRLPLDDDSSNADFSISTTAASRPDPVTAVTSTAGAGQVDVAWTMPTPIGSVDRVRVYRANTAHDIPVQVHQTANNTVTNWTDTAVTNAQRYWYYVRTVDAAGREGRLMQAGAVTAEYYDGASFDSFRARQVETTGFEGGKAFGSNDGPVAFGDAPDWLDYDIWSARYSGYLYVPETTTYRVRIYRRVGARLWIDGQQLLNEWYTVDNGAYDSYVTVQLSEGIHPYRLEYTHWGSDAFLYFQTNRLSDWTQRDVGIADLSIERSTSAVPKLTTVAVTAPNGGESWRAHRRETISWSTTGSDADKVDLWYSTDGGASYPWLITRGLATTGSFDWLVPDDLSSTQVRVRAVAVTNARETIVADSSDANMTIDTTSVPPGPVSDVGASPGNAQVTVSWTLPSPIGTVDRIRVYRAPNAHDIPTQVHQTASNAVTSWVDTTVSNGQRYWYYIRTVDAAGRESRSIQAGTVNAEYYDGASFDTFKARQVETTGFEGGKSFGNSDGPIAFGDAPDWMDFDIWSARWSGQMYVPESTTYRIRVYRRVGARLWIDGQQLLNEWYTVDNGAYDSDWMTVQLTAGWHPFRLEYTHWGSDAFMYFQTIRLADWTWRDVDSTRLATERSASTVPKAAAVTLTTPNGGEAWRARRAESISWSTAGGGADKVDLWYSTDGGATYPWLIARGQPTSGSFDWLVPSDTNTNQVRVRAVAVTNAGESIASDASDASFEIDTESTRPDNVTDVTATPGMGEVDVRWTMPSPIGSVDHVRIYRSNDLHALPTMVHETADATTTSWTDTSTINGTRYFYFVRTVDATGRENARMQTGALDASYYGGANLDTFRYTATENYGFEGGRTFGATDFPLSPEYPGESPSGDIWSAKWSGQMYVPAGTTYRIRIHRRVGARLWIDGQQLLNEWYTVDNGAYDSNWMTIQLTEGWHPFRLEFTHWGSDAFINFQTIHQGDWNWRDVDVTRIATERHAAATPFLATLDVTSPDGGETWGSTLDRTITWSSASMPLGTTYRVRYSTDGGRTFDRIIASGLTNTTLDWHPPEGITTTAARIRVEAVAVTGTVLMHADSASNFSIQSAALPPVSNVNAVPGWSQVQLSWTNPASALLDHVNIYRTTTPWQLGTKVATVSAPTAAWTDLAVVNGTRYWYSVRAATVTDDESFAMQPGGLRGDYYTGADFQTFTGSQLDPTIDMNWGAGGPAVLGATTDNFSVRWTGYIRADQDAFWELDNNRPTRDGGRINVNGQMLVNRWNPGDTDAGATGYMQLQNGWHRITVEYHETTGNAYTALYHARPGLARRVVPASELATEAQATAVPIDPNPPSPNPAGTVQAISPTEIEWSMMTVVDVESGLPATPFSYDNGSTWVGGSTYTRTGLSPNTSYTQTLRARDAYGNLTTPNVLTARTLAVAPSISADRATGTWHGPNAVNITFSNLAVFGTGGVEYYRWVLGTNASHTFDDTEAVWNSGNLVRNVATSGVYYFHARSYNADGVASGQTVLGPFWIDAEAPTPNPATITTTPTLSSVTFDIDAMTDSHSGLHASPYSFDNGASWQASDTNAATGLAPNTESSRQVRVRDAIGNVSTVTAVTAATLPVDPGVTSVPAGGATWHPGGTTVSVTSTVPFGPGTLWGYRWRATTDAGDTVLDADPAWTSGALPVVMPSTGTYFLRARSYNSTGVGGNTATLGPFKIDATPPPGTVPSAPSPTAVAPVLTWSAVTDADSGLSGYRVYRSTTSGALGSQIASVAGTTWTDPDTLVDDTTYWYTVQAVDNVANEQTVGNTQIAVTYSSAPPTGSSIAIAGGAGAVAAPAVTLTLASANAVDMMVSNAPDFAGGTWEPYSATLGWTLLAGADGSRSVYARFRNAGGTVSSAVVDSIDLDTTAPSPSPPAVTSVVGSATEITWNVQAVTDALVGLPAQPYSLDDGATWQAGTSVVASALAPNTEYTRIARTRDALGNTSAQGTATATTLPAAPAVSSTPAPDPLPQPRGTTFTFTNDAGWGAGAVEYYRWAWTTSATHAFAGTEAIWGSGTLARQEFTAGTYYLHVQAYSSADAAGQVLTLGPYGVAPPQDDTELTMNIASTQTISCTATNFTVALLPGTSDDATIDCDVTSTLAGWNLAAHADTAPFFTDFLDASATPAAYAPPAAADAQIAFTASGAKSEATFANGTLWRGFAGLTDIRIGSDTGISAGDTITTRVRAELGASAGIPAGARTQTVTFTLNPGT
jgi:predicted phage tail protein